MTSPLPAFLLMLRSILMLSLGLLAALPLRAQAPDSATYHVYTASGQPASLGDVAEAMGGADVVFLGEQHDDPVAHQLQAELLRQALAAYVAERPVALSLEMFERDVQPILDEFLADLISESHFVKSSRAPANYEAAYKPLVDLAKANGLAVLAANAPRRYVNRVTRLGPAALDTLSGWAKTFLPPLPYPGPSAAYAEKWNQMMADMMARHAPPPALPDSAEHDLAPARHPADTEHASDGAADEEAVAEPAGSLHGGSYLLDAQALWDAAMAHALARHLDAHPGALVLHVVGSFHVEGGLGTPAQLDAYRPGTRQLVVVVKAVEDITAFDAETMAGLGDFVILSDKAAR